jgi:quinol-cytochrome oxidoreductase complex cytochrome b subunit
MLPALLAGLIGVHLFLIIKHGESHYPEADD